MRFMAAASSRRLNNLAVRPASLAGLAGRPARPHFEGYLLIIGLALIAYGLLTIAAMLTAARARSRRASAPPS